MPGRAVETATLDVAAPLLIILLGAAVGGLLAYIVLPQAHAQLTRTASAQFFYAKVLLGFAGSMLLAIIISILWARLSEAASLLRLTVSDVWGGIAVGFLANYFGVGIINRMIKGLKPGSEQQSGAGGESAEKPGGGEGSRAMSRPDSTTVIRTHPRCEVRPHSSLGNLTPKEYSTTVGLAWKVDQILGAGHNSEPFGKSICPLM